MRSSILISTLLTHFFSSYLPTFHAQRCSSYEFLHRFYGTFSAQRCSSYEFLHRFYGIPCTEVRSTCVPPSLSPPFSPPFPFLLRICFLLRL